MKTKTTITTTLSVLLILLLAACGGAAPESAATAAPATLDPAAMDAAVAATVSAELTRIALENPSATPEPATATPTTAPSETPTEAIPPTATTGPEALGNHALFLADVTIPDGTQVTAGETFTKTWRLQNIGFNTWTTEYSVVFINGERMEGQPINLPVGVPPGGIIEITIVMVAPDEVGVQEGFWMLADADDVLFGLGANATGAFSVSIVVLPAPTATPTLAPTETATIEPTATP